MKKSQWLLIGITAAFVCLLVGVFVGRNLTASYIALGNSANSETQSGSQSTTAGKQEYDGKIDINTASAAQLQLVPGVGEAIAQRILDYRTEHGDFKSVDELLEVSGIGEKKLEQMKPYIKVQAND